MPIFRLGTRGSQLAVAQSSLVADMLRSLGAHVDLVVIRTTGDDRPPDTAWGEGAFVGALEEALLDGSVDLAVHSAKDVPTAEPDGLVIAAYPTRADPRDALVGRHPGTTLAELPDGARVGTDSPRRTAFLRAIRPDLRIHPLHGNVDTRLRRLDTGETDVLVLAVAGLTRLGRVDRIGEILAPELVAPAPGQGALAIQCRRDDPIALEWLGRLDDPATRAAVEAERTFLRITGGGCRAPVGALATIDGTVLHLAAVAAGPEAPLVGVGDRPVVVHGDIRGPVHDGLRLAAELAVRLGAELAASRPAGETQRRRVLITRPADGSTPLVAALEAAGIAAVAVPAISIELGAPGGALDDALETAPAGSWIVATSRNAVRATLAAAVRTSSDPASLRWAVVGTGTAGTLREAGVEPDLVASRPDGATLAAELPVDPGVDVLLPQASLADPSLATTLRERGARVTAIVAYTTEVAPASSREPLRAALADGPVDAIVLASPSAVRGLVALLDPEGRSSVLGTTAVCIGETTRRAAAAAGFTRLLTADTSTPDAIVARIVEQLEG